MHALPPELFDQGLKVVAGCDGDDFVWHRQRDPKVAFLIETTAVSRADHSSCFGAKRPLTPNFGNGYAKYGSIVLSRA